MVVLALAFLALMTLALPHTFVVLPEEAASAVAAEIEVLEPSAAVEAEAPAAKLSPLERAHLLTMTAVVGLVILAIPFWAEAVVRLLWIERGPLGACGVPRADRKRVLHVIACALVPPLRPGLNPAKMRERCWLPIFGWRVTSRPLSRRVQKLFGIPMLLIGLLILPVLLAEMALAEQVRQHAALALGLDIATRLIWFAFALEFLILLAVTPRKVEYAVRHWVDLVIILLPFAAFLRSLQVVRAGQLLKAQQMSKLAVTYRLRGLAIKVLQAVLLLRVLENLSDGMAKKRIRKVRETIARRTEEISELNAELIELRASLAERLRKKRLAKRKSESEEREEREEKKPLPSSAPSRPFAASPLRAPPAPALDRVTSNE